LCIYGCLPENNTYDINGTICLCSKVILQNAMPVSNQVGIFIEVSGVFLFLMNLMTKATEDIKQVYKQSQLYHSVRDYIVSNLGFQH